MFKMIKKGCISIKESLVSALKATKTNKKPWLTLSLIALNIGAFMFTVHQGLFNNFHSYIETLTNAGAFTSAANQGEFWRYISSMFLHANSGHLISNMISLAIFGYILESIYKQNRLTLLSIYLLSGILSNLGFLIMFNAETPTAFLGVGASGAIAGLVPYTLLAATQKYFSTPKLNQKHLGLAIKANNIIFLTLCILPLLSDTIYPDATIGHWVHAIGALCGLIFGSLAIGTAWKKSIAEKTPKAKIFLLSMIKDPISMASLSAIFWSMNANSTDTKAIITLLFSLWLSIFLSRLIKNQINEQIENENQQYQDIQEF